MVIQLAADPEAREKGIEYRNVFTSEDDERQEFDGYQLLLLEIVYDKGPSFLLDLLLLAILNGTCFALHFFSINQSVDRFLQMNNFLQKGTKY